MGVREFDMDQSAAWGIVSLHGDALRAQLRAFVRYNGLPAAGKGATVTAAPSLIEQYRNDPFGVRERIEREARRARSQMVGEWLSRIFE
jgi:hypothetical protein